MMGRTHHRSSEIVSTGVATLFFQNDAAFSAAGTPMAKTQWIGVYRPQSGWGAIG
jgi:hypothetical protein